MREAIAERRVIALLDHDEALRVRSEASLLDASDRIKARLAAQGEG